MFSVTGQQDFLSLDMRERKEDGQGKKDSGNSHIVYLYLEKKRKLKTTFFTKVSGKNL